MKKRVIYCVLVWVHFYMKLLKLEVCDHAVSFTYFAPEYAVNEVQEIQEGLELNGLYRVYVDAYEMSVSVKG